MVKSTKQLVLKELLKNSADWLSGDTLAQQFGVTRETIWKAIKALRKRGIKIESRKRAGYQYQGSINLDADIINLLLSRSLGKNLHVYNQITSTQLVAKETIIKEKLVTPNVWVADQQTAGYGRRGRSFYSPATSGVYLSLALPNPTTAWPSEGTLIINTAVIILKTLKRFFPHQPLSFKWVNDIYLNHLKVGGIITEANLEMESNFPSSFIIGMGLNLTTANFPVSLANKAGAIDNQAQIDRNQLVANLLNELLSTNLLVKKTSSLQFYREHSLLLGKQIQLMVGNKVFRGLMTGIADNGGIVIKNPRNELQTFTAGEVTKVKW